VTRIEQIIFAMRAELTAQCRLVKAAAMVLGESPDCPERDAVGAAIAAQAHAAREACRAYNNVRSLAGSLERAIGNHAPQFYEGDLRECGLPIDGCHCCTEALRSVDVAHVQARQVDLDVDDRHRAQEGQDDSGK